MHTTETVTRWDDGLGVRRRIEIVEAAIDTFARLGYRTTTIEDVAETLRSTPEVIGKHFPQWSGLVLAVVDRWNKRRLDHVAAEGAGRDTVYLLRRLVAYNVDNPGLMRLLVALANEATDPAHPAGAYFRDRYQEFHQVVSQGLARDIQMGRLPAHLDPEDVADQMIALYEGLQLQSMLRPRLDLSRAFGRAMDALVQNW